jgi:hypothetical protein
MRTCGRQLLGSVNHWRSLWVWDWGVVTCVLCVGNAWPRFLSTLRLYNHLSGLSVLQAQHAHLIQMYIECACLMCSNVYMCSPRGAGVRGSSENGACGQVSCCHLSSPLNLGGVWSLFTVLCIAICSYLCALTSHHLFPALSAPHIPSQRHTHQTVQTLLALLP